MVSQLTARFFSALGCGQHSSPSAFDPGFLTHPAVSFPERADTLFDPCTLLQVLAKAHAAAGSQQMCKQDWQTGSSLSHKRLCRLHQGGPSLLLITASGKRRGRSLCTQWSPLLGACSVEILALISLAELGASWSASNQLYKGEGQADLSAAAVVCNLTCWLWLRVEASHLWPPVRMVLFRGVWSCPESLIPHRMCILSIVSVNAEVGYQVDFGLSVVAFPIISSQQTPNRD